MIPWIMNAGLAFARAASHPIVSGGRTLDIASNQSDSAAMACHHLTLAFGPAPLPGPSRLSSPVASPGTGSLFAVGSLEAQPFTPQAKTARSAISQRDFIRFQN